MVLSFYEMPHTLVSLNQACIRNLVVDQLYLLAEYEVQI